MKVKFELNEYHRDISGTELISDIQRVSRYIKKKSVTIEEYNEYGKYNSSTLQRRFGSWFVVLEKAGLNKTRSLGITNEEYFQNLRECWEKLGRQPKYIEMKKPFSSYVAGAYEYRFGTWRKALKAFIFYINNDNSEKIDDNIKNQKNDLKIKNVQRNYKKNRNISSALRFRILLRDGFTCCKCGKSPLKEKNVELHVDHIIPYSKGGETIPENLETKCSICNLGKGNQFYV